MTLDCVSDLMNIGASSCKMFPQALESGIKTGIDFEATVAEIADPAFWQGKLEAGEAERIYLFPLAYEFENVSEEANRASSNLGKEVMTRQGQYRFRYSFRENLETHKAMYSHLGSAGRWWPIDTTKKILATLGSKPESGEQKYRGFLIDQFTPEKIQFGDGSTPSLSPVYITLASNEELDRYGFQFDFSYQLLALKPLTDYKITVTGTPTATEVRVKVKSSTDGVPLKGLTTADWKIAGLTGATGVTEVSNGEYTVTGTAMTGGVLDLNDPASLSVRGVAGVPVTITI